MGWQDDQIVAPAQPAPETAPWERDAILAPAAGPRVGHGIVDAIRAGYQGSVPGLVDRGKLPDVVLDPQHATWLEKLAASGSQLVNEGPEMIAGAVAGGAAGAGAGGPLGAVIGAGAGAMAVPTAIRQSLIQAYSKGDVVSSADFLNRAAIVIKQTAKDAVIGGATSLAGPVASRALGKTIAPMIGESISVPAAQRLITGIGVAAEVGTMAVAPPLLEGRLPEPEDFLNAAVMVGGLKTAGVVAGRLRDVYAKTGKTPEEVVADAKADPTIAEDLLKPADDAAPATEVPRAYQDIAAAQNAADAVPGVKAQEVASQPFGPVEQAPGEPAAPTAVNYNYLNTPEDVKGAMARLSQVYEADIQAQRRGTVGWEQTQVEAGRILSDMLGSTEPFQPREPGTPAGAAELLARKQMVVGAAEDMATRARDFLAKGTNATPEETAAFLASIDRAAMIQSEFLGARAEAGRALNILKETKIAAERAQQIQELIARFGKSPEELAAMVAQLDNPAAALKFAKEATKATTWDKVVEAWKAGLVSGPITQLANILGNVSFIALRPAVDGIAASFGALSRSADRVAAAEPLARIVGNLQGMRDGLKLAKVAFMEDSPGGKAEHRHAIEGTAGYAIRTPFRALAAGDAIFRTMNERGEAYALAARQAAKEGLHPASREFRERMAEIAANPTEDMAQQIQDAGARLVFNAKLGEKGRAVNQFIKAWHLEWAVPFVSTPGNVFKEMTRLTPAAPIIGEWRDAVAKGGAEAQKALAEVALGTGVSALAFSFALSGKLSGSGSPDPAKRNVQMASGWQPYSVKVGNTWYSYQRMQPLGTLLGMAADMAEAWEHMTPEESDKVPKILATAFANAVTNQTFLSGMAALVDAMSEPDRFGPRFIQNMAASTVPAIAGQTAQLMDPYAREIQSVKDAVQNRLPIARESLMPKRDPFGEAVQNPDRVAGISPITTATPSTDKVRSEAARLEIGVGSTPKTVQMPSGGDRKLGQIELTAQQRDAFGDVAGHTAYAVMGQMVNSPLWDAMPDMVKKRAFSIAFEKSREAGRVAALSDDQRQQEIARITGEVAKRLAAQ